MVLGPLNMKLQHRLVCVLVLVLVLCGGQIAGAKPRPSQCDPNVEKNYNYAGNDLVINGSSTGVQAKSIADCCQICQSLADAKPKGCSFYTYRHSLSMCHPKFSNAGRTSSSGATSGSCTPTPPPILTRDVATLLDHRFHVQKLTNAFVVPRYSQVIH